MPYNPSQPVSMARVEDVVHFASWRSVQAQDPSSSPLVNMLVIYRAQLDVLYAMNAFNDNASVIGRQLFGQYETIASAIDAHIAWARKEYEPKVDMDQFMQNGQQPSYEDDELTAGTPTAKAVVKSRESLVRKGAMHVDSLSPSSDVELIEAAHNVARMMDHELQQHYELEKEELTEKIRKADTLLSGLELGDWSSSFEDKHMDELVEAHRRNRDAPDASISPFRVLPAYHSKDVKDWNEMKTNATPEEDMQRIWQGNWAQAFAGTGPLEDFYDTTIIPFRPVGDRVLTSWSGAHFALSYLKYTWVWARQHKIAAASHVVPWVLALAFPQVGLIGVAGSWLGLKVLDHIVNRKAEENGVVAVGLMVGGSTVGRPVLDGVDQEWVLLNHANDLHVAGVENLADMGARLLTVQEQQRVTANADLARRCAQNQAVENLCRNKKVVSFAEQIGENPFKRLGRWIGRNLWYAKQGAADSELANAAADSAADLENASTTGSLSVLPFKVLRILTTTYSLLSDYAWRYRPDRARMYIYLNHPTRKTTQYGGAAAKPNAVYLQVQEQRLVLSVLRVMLKAARGSEPLEPGGPTRREWLGEKVQEHTDRIRLWMQIYNGDYLRYANLNVAGVVNIAESVRTYVKHLLDLRQELTKHFLITDEYVRTLCRPRAFYVRYAEWSPLLKKYQKAARAANGRGLRPQGSPATLTAYLGNEEVGHDWRALYHLLQTLMNYLHGEHHVGAVLTEGELGTLLADMSRAFSYAAQQEREGSDLGRGHQPLRQIVDDQLRELKRLFEKYLRPRHADLPNNPHWNQPDAQVDLAPLVVAPNQPGGYLGDLADWARRRLGRPAPPAALAPPGPPVHPLPRDADLTRLAEILNVVPDVRADGAIPAIAEAADLPIPADAPRQADDGGLGALGPLQAQPPQPPQQQPQPPVAQGVPVFQAQQPAQAQASIVDEVFARMRVS